jgi:hypothetical protein
VNGTAQSYGTPGWGRRSDASSAAVPGSFPAALRGQTVVLLPMPCRSPGPRHRASPSREKRAPSTCPVFRTPGYRVTVPVKVSRPSPRPDSNTALIRPPPLSPSKRPRPFTTFQSPLCFRPGCVVVKVIIRVPPEQRKLTTVSSGGFSGPSMNLPPAQKAESPMVDPERTSPVVSPLALRGAACV